MSPYPSTLLSRRLTERGLREVADWCTHVPTQVTGRIPPAGEWFYYRERSGFASLEIYPADRYPFAAPGSKSNAGFDSMALADEPAMLWAYSCDTPDEPSDEYELAETLIFRFIGLWRSGEPANFD